MFALSVRATADILSSAVFFTKSAILEVDCKTEN